MLQTVFLLYSPPFTITEKEHEYVDANKKSKTSNAGRPTGGTGGGTGGNMFHADKVNPDVGRKNRRLEDYDANQYGDESGSDSDVVGSDDGETQRSSVNKAEEKKRLDEAVEALMK